MKYLKKEIIEYTEDKKTVKKAPLFAPAGQSTQMVIGATPENDMEILWMANQFYQKDEFENGFTILAMCLLVTIIGCLLLERQFR